MSALKQARKIIANEPESKTAQILSRLVLSLETDQAMSLREIYELDYSSFQLAIDVMRDWRIDRYYASKVKLIDLSLQVR
ncbi:MAG: hypothetical protein RLZZ123_933 [Pseudomonadota bacterium]|jgi:hypothetical protein